MNGYTLTCSSQWGWYYTTYEYDVEGIRVSASGVKILGPGKITNCGRAVTLAGNNTTIEDLTLTHNQTGIVLLGGNPLLRHNMIVNNNGNGIELNSMSGAILRENYIAGNGNWGVTNITGGSVTFDGNFILGNGSGGIGELGPSGGWSATLSNNVILGSGTWSNRTGNPATWTPGLDLSLRDNNDYFVGTNICETSSPSGLCPHPLPPFPFDAPTNQPPTASFTAATADLTVTVTDASTDADGTIASRSWNYGDGTDPTTQTTHTYASAGSYAVMLTVTDNGGATASTARSVTVSVPVPVIHVGDLDGTASTLMAAWQAAVAVTVHTSAEAPVSDALVYGTWSGGVTGTASCATTTGTCTVISPQVPSKKSSVTFTISGVTHPTSPYNAGANHDVDGGSNGTTITITKP